MALLGSLLQARVRRVCRSKTRLALRHDATATLVYLDYLQFMRELLHEAQREAHADGLSEVLLVHLQRVAGDVLRRFRG